MEYKEIIDNKRIKYYLPEYFTPAQEFTFLSNWHYKIFCVNGNTGFVFFILYICKMKKIMKEKNQVVPNEV